MTLPLIVGLVVQGRRCLVVGSGDDAEQRLRDLRDAGAEVALVTPGAFVESDLDGTWLAVLSARDEPLARRMFALAEARRTPFCAVDQPAYSSYFHLAQVRAGTLQVAVGTAGRAPSLARRLKEELQRLLDEAGAASFVDELHALRDETASADRKRVLGRAVAAVRFTGKLLLGREP